MNLPHRRRRAKQDLGLHTEPPPDQCGEAASASEPTTPSIETAAPLPEWDASQAKIEDSSKNSKSNGTELPKEAEKSSYPAVVNPPKLHISSIKLESPKLQKNFKKFSAQSSVFSAKIGDSLSGYMEKISMKMKTDNLSALSSDFGERKRSPPLKRSSEFRKSLEETSVNIYEVIEVPKAAQGLHLTSVRSYP